MNKSKIKNLHLVPIEADLGMVSEDKQEKRLVEIELQEQVNRFVDFGNGCRQSRVLTVDY